MDIAEEKSISFAHPAEATFAQILDYYQVDWLYEPRTFPLYWDDEHRIIEAFTPDFYLPEQDLYVELTTLRPQLTNHKHRKMRRMHELYPDVKIKLMKRRDLRDLMRKYGFHDQAAEIDGRSAQNGG